MDGAVCMNGVMMDGTVGGREEKEWKGRREGREEDEREKGGGWEGRDRRRLGGERFAEVG
jgi:hypothetical protein